MYYQRCLTETLEIYIEEIRPCCDHFLARTFLDDVHFQELFKDYSSESKYIFQNKRTFVTTLCSIPHRLVVFQEAIDRYSLVWILYETRFECSETKNPIKAEKYRVVAPFGQFCSSDS